MMEMDGRGNVKCQKSKRRDIDVILEILSEIGQNMEIVFISFKIPKTGQQGAKGEGMQWGC